MDNQNKNKTTKIKQAVLTGGTGDMGEIICEWLLSQDYRVIVPYRNEAKKERLIQFLKGKNIGIEEIIFIPCDFTSLKSVDTFLQQVATVCGEGLDVLINNAGVIAPEFSVTADGYEKSMQVNYLVPRRIIESLLPIMKEGGRIVNTISCTVKIGKVQPIEKISESNYKTACAQFNHLRNYSNSKLMLALYSMDLFQQLKEKSSFVSVCCADPGVVNTAMIHLHRWYDRLADWFFRPLIASPAKGAHAIIHALEANRDNLNLSHLTVFMQEKQVRISSRVEKQFFNQMHRLEEDKKGRSEN